MLTNDLTFIALGRCNVPLAKVTPRDIRSLQTISIGTTKLGLHAVLEFGGDDKATLGSRRQLPAAGRSADGQLRPRAIEALNARATILQLIVLDARDVDPLAVRHTLHGQIIAGTF